MQHLLTRIVILALLSLPSWALSCPRQSKTAAELIQTEQSWAQALDNHDTNSVACILGAEFEDADPSGQLHNREQTLAQIPKRRPGRNKLSELHPHVLGDYGYIRGLARFEDAQGKTVARVRFTDIYAYRDGRWVALAGQETLLPEEK